MLIKPDIKKLFKESVYVRPFLSLIDANICPICKRSIREKDFKTEKAKKVYTNNGICEKCQNDIGAKRDLIY